jgi:hypothetical protein
MSRSYHDCCRLNVCPKFIWLAGCGSSHCNSNIQEAKVGLLRVQDHPGLYIETLSFKKVICSNPHGIILGSKTFGRSLIHKDEVPMNGISDILKEIPESFLIALYHVRTQWEIDCLQPRKDVTRSGPCWQLDHKVPGSRTGKINVFLLSHPACGNLL